MSKDTHVLSNSWGGVDYSQALQVCQPSTCLPSLSTNIEPEPVWLPKLAP